jgi:hypothetical protein
MLRANLRPHFPPVVFLPRCFRYSRIPRAALMKLLQSDWNHRRPKPGSASSRLSLPAAAVPSNRLHRLRTYRVYQPTRQQSGCSHRYQMRPPSSTEKQQWDIVSSRLPHCCLMYTPTPRFHRCQTRQQPGCSPQNQRQGHTIAGLRLLPAAVLPSPRWKQRSRNPQLSHLKDTAQGTEPTPRHSGQIVS